MPPAEDDLIDEQDIALVLPDDFDNDGIVSVEGESIEPGIDDAGD